jgi:hypothetical protein
VTKKKKILIALLVIVVAAAALLGIGALTGKEKGLFAMPATETTIARERTYQAYLDSFGYANELAQAEIALDVFAFEKSEDSNAMALTEGVDTGDTGAITWKFNVEETGFYNLVSVTNERQYIIPYYVPVDQFLTMNEIVRELRGE